MGVIMSSVDFITVDQTRFEFTQPRHVVLRRAGGCLQRFPAMSAGHHGARPTTDSTPALPDCRGRGKVTGLNGHHALWNSLSSSVLFTK